MRLSPSILARATLAATLLALAAIGGACAWRLWQAADWLAALHPGLVEPFATDGVTTHAQGVGVLLAVAAVVAVAGGLAAFLPGRFALRLVRLGFWTSYLGLAAWLVLVTRGVGVIGEKKLMVDGLQQDAVTLFTLWWSLVGPALLTLAMALFGHEQSWRGSTILRPSTSQRTGSLVSATHQLWSSPRRTMHQSRVEVALAMIQMRILRSVRGEF